MKTTIYLVAVAVLLLTAFAPATNSDTQIKGAWKLVRAQYGNDPMKDRSADDLTHKLFTGTRWSAAFYNKATKKLDGTGGGTYKITGDQYSETVEYFSWDPAVEGKTFTLTMTIENGMLHQKGTIEYNGNSKYSIDEWYVRVD
jgi:uncharacterized protein (DUF2147 family)